MFLICVILTWWFARILFLVETGHSKQIFNIITNLELAQADICLSCIFNNRENLPSSFSKEWWQANCLIHFFLFFFLAGLATSLRRTTLIPVEKRKKNKKHPSIQASCSSVTAKAKRICVISAGHETWFNSCVAAFVDCAFQPQMRACVNPLTAGASLMVQRPCGLRPVCLRQWCQSVAEVTGGHFDPCKDNFNFEPLANPFSQ